MVEVFSNTALLLLFWLTFAAAQAWALQRTSGAIARWLGLYAAGILLGSLATSGVFFALVYSGLDILQNRQHSLFVIVTSAAVFGSAMALTQWVALRRRTHAPYWAIAITAAAIASWIAGVYWSLALPYVLSLPELLTFGLPLLAGAAVGGVSGGLVGSSRDSGSQRQRLTRGLITLSAIVLAAGLSAIPAHEIQNIDTQRVTLNEAQATLAFPLLVPTALPEGYAFDYAYITQYPDSAQNVALFYQGPSSQIVINQSPIPKGDQSPLSPSPKTLRLRGQPARLEATTMPTLLWQERGMQLSIHSLPLNPPSNSPSANSPPPDFSENPSGTAPSGTDLIELAEAMQWTPQP